MQPVLVHCPIPHCPCTNRLMLCHSFKGNIKSKWFQTSSIFISLWLCFWVSTIKWLKQFNISLTFTTHQHSNPSGMQHLYKSPVAQRSSDNYWKVIGLTSVGRPSISFFWVNMNCEQDGSKTSKALVSPLCWLLAFSRKSCNKLFLAYLALYLKTQYTTRFLTW